MPAPPDFPTQDYYSPGLLKMVRGHPSDLGLDAARVPGFCHGVFRGESGAQVDVNILKDSPPCMSAKSRSFPRT